ncbi:invasion associated locus B family protein [Pseudooceanicola sp. LIPI14-2-Ac024]|uniref:invasion associated locus B family protein n=1 Tax=Pseudooceanicola sp. LIPI14-2-Ac024 TaxID=3344875 RepID=UPI0035D0DEAD
MKNTVAGVAAAILTIAASGAAMAQSASENQVAAKTDWSVFVEDDPKECWAVSAPKETVNTKDGRVVSVRRSDILFMAFYRPGADVQGQITFTGGYPFRDRSTVNLNIDGTEFELFTEGEWAWAASPAEDAKILTALKRGSNAVISGISGRGTATKDTFSLLGFTAAVEDAERRCTG